MASKGGNREEGSKLSTSQVIYNPQQVTGVDQLQIGKTYIEFCQGKPVERVTVTRIDRERGFFKSDDTSLEGVPAYPGTRFMRDYGILPNESGLWNSTYWLVPEESLK